MIHSHAFLVTPEINCQKKKHTPIFLPVKYLCKSLYTLVSTNGYYQFRMLLKNGNNLCLFYHMFLFLCYEYVCRLNITIWLKTFYLKSLILTSLVKSKSWVKLYYQESRDGRYKPCESCPFTNFHKLSNSYKIEKYGKKSGKNREYY